MAEAPDQVWERIQAEELALPGVTSGTGFGRNEGLRVSGKIFAIRLEDGVVVKLPRERVEELVGSGDGRVWGPGHGRVMKEWVALSSSAASQWAALVAEAREFVVSLRSR